MALRLPTAILAIAVTLLVSGGRVPVLAREAIVHAYWVPSSSLQSPESIRRMVATAAANGFNTLFVPVLGEAAGFDPLMEAIDAARERGLRVHAWLHVNMVSNRAELQASRDAVIYQHPEWLMVPRDMAVELQAIDVRSPEYLGRLTRWTRANADRVDGLYLSPLHEGAQAFVAAMVADLVKRYAIDGIHLDDLRFPATDFDYSRGALEAFRAHVREGISAAELAKLDAVMAIDPFAYPELRAEEWRLFRQTRLTALVTRLRSTARAIRPDVFVSASVDSDVVTAARESFQDWRTWVDNGFVDALCAIGTGNEAAGSAARLAEVRALAGSRPVWVRD